MVSAISLGWFAEFGKTLPLFNARPNWFILTNGKHPWPQMLVTSKVAFLENYLAVNAWILNGSSVECHEKKLQPFLFIYLLTILTISTLLTYRNNSVYNSTMNKVTVHNANLYYIT